MPLDILPAKLVTLTRDQRRDRFIRDLVIRNPQALTLPGTDPYLDANVFADATDVHVANAVFIANGVSRATAIGPALDDWGARINRPRLGPVGGSGAVSIATGSSGVQLYAGDRLVYQPTGQRFQFIGPSGTYQNGATVAVLGVDTGPGTNLAAGLVLTWQTSRPGLQPSATIVTQADGSGLSGGNNAEDDPTYRAALDYIYANPPASGNDAQIQLTVSQTPTVAVQQCFTFPACMGPGSSGVCFTLRPSQPGANRIPNATQVALVSAYLQGQMPGDMGFYLITITAQPTTVVLKALWAPGAAGWADTNPWPTYIASPNLVSVATPSSGTTSATYFRLNATGITTPQVGQSIAFYDSANLVFRRKKIGSFVTDGAGGFDITVDTSSGVSDTSYVPSIGQPACPWSDSLNSLVLPVTAYFDTLGPGEQFAAFFDPGLRQRRSPLSPQYWPSPLTNRLLGGAQVPQPPAGPVNNLPPVPTLLTLTQLQDVVLTEPTTLPFNPTTGTPGTSVNMLTLGTLLAFPE